MNYSNLNYNDLLNEISSVNGAPSGGSVIAMVAGEACSLAIMIVTYSINNKNLKLFKNEFLDIKKDLDTLKEKFSNMVDEDIINFQDLKKAYSFPVNSGEDRETKDSLISDGSRKANMVPLEILKECYNIVEVLERLKLTVNDSLMCDVGVCASLIKSVICSCHMTILSNLTNINDSNYISDCLDSLNKADIFNSKLDNIVADIIDKENSKLNIEISRNDS